MYMEDMEARHAYTQSQSDIVGRARNHIHIIITSNGDLEAFGVLVTATPRVTCSHSL